MKWKYPGGATISVKVACSNYPKKYKNLGMGIKTQKVQRQSYSNGREYGTCTRAKADERDVLDTFSAEMKNERGMK